MAQFDDEHFEGFLPFGESLRKPKVAEVRMSLNRLKFPHGPEMP
jgi:hypothetical protein